MHYRMHIDTRMPRRLPALIALVAVLGAGCASTPEPLRGEFSEVNPATSGAGDIGEAVRWGGRLLAVHPESTRTCFEVLAAPLTRSGRPETNGGYGRRFLACRDGFMDPAAFPADREVTITGTLSDFELRPIGAYEYRFPVIAATTIHLWPQRVEPRYYDPYPYYGPYWRYDPFYDPFWYSRPYYRRH